MIRLWTWILGFNNKALTWIGAGLALVGAVVAIYLKGKGAAKRQMTVEQVSKTLNDLKAGKEIKHEVDRLDAAAVDEQLREHQWYRP